LSETFLSNGFTPITPQGDGNRATRGWPRKQPHQQPGFTPITPQGDGNLSNENCNSPVLDISFTPITPQGDGNQFHSTLREALPHWVSHPLPRKGTETTAVGTTAVLLPIKIWVLSFTPITPQGDGNVRERWKREDRRGKKMRRNEKDTKLQQQPRA
jgi:hypothetical protein